MAEAYVVSPAWSSPFEISPSLAHDIQVNEFDFRDNGGVVYENNGVKVIHWQRSHAKDGASGYLANQIKPRMFMTTHMNFGPFLNEESVAAQAKESKNSR